MCHRSNKVEEDFLNEILRTCFDLLEVNEVCKTDKIKGLLFDLIQATFENFHKHVENLHLNLTTSMVNLLYSQDDVALPLATFINTIYKLPDETSNLAFKFLKQLV